MSEKIDKKDVNAKMEKVDVSGYMPPGMGPVSPYSPGYYPQGPCPSMPCPHPPEHEDMYMLRDELMKLRGQQVTVYVMGLGPVAPVPVMPSGGSMFVPGSGSVGITGILHEVGGDFITIHVDMATTRVVYISMMAIAVIVPGGPLEPNVQANVVTTLPETAI